VAESKPSFLKWGVSSPLVTALTLTVIFPLVGDHVQGGVFLVETDNFDLLGSASLAYSSSFSWTRSKWVASFFASSPTNVCSPSVILIEHF